jgi:hypothetical protein
MVQSASARRPRCGQIVTWTRRGFLEHYNSALCESNAGAWVVRSPLP